MATVHLSPIGNAFQFLDANGKPLNAGQVFTYAAGTSTPQATYGDSSGAFPNTNPIVLGTDGRVPAEVWLVDGLSYKFVLEDVLGNPIASYDNIYGLAKTTAQENFNVKDFGAIGDGVSDDSPAIQAALNAVSATGGTVFFPDGKYRAHGLLPKANTQVQLSGGAVLLADGQLLQLINGSFQTPTLAAITNNGYAAQVSSTAGMNAGDYVVISGGSAGGNTGPCEFNQIDIVSDATHLVFRNPAQINYATVGFPGASPKVFGLGPSPMRNFRLTGGTITSYSAANVSALMAFIFVENVEIDHVLFDGGGTSSTATGLGAGIVNGTTVSNFVFRNNLIRGERTTSSFASAVVINSCANSIFRDNTFNIGNPFAGTYTVCAANHISLPACSWRNRIDSNLMYPIAMPSFGAIDLPSYSFMNMIRGNQIYGSPFAVQTGVLLIGIDTQRAANAPLASGNVISGNILNDVMTGIIDVQVSSVIKDNICSNFNLNAASVGISSGTSESLSPWFTNTFVNFQVTVQQTGGGAAGRIQLGSVTFANVGTPVNGTMLFVSDGTPASNPLTGAGTGCVAIRQNGAWKGL